MRSASDLMATARATMKKWPALFSPPILMNLVQSLAGIQLTSGSLQMISALTANAGAMIINAGWLEMIGAALKDQPPGMSHFKEGINRRWGQILLGSLMFMLLLALMMGALVWFGDGKYGIAPLMSWFETVEKLKAAELSAALQPDKLPAAVRGWMYLLTAWMGGAALLFFLLLFWQPLVVLRNMSWWRGWLASARLVFKRFPMVLGFALMHLLAFGLGLSLMGGGSLLVALFGLFFLLFVMTFFKVLYAAVVVDAYPEPQIDVTA